MEAIHPRKNIFREVDSSEKFRNHDEANYYLGDNFEMRGVESGPHEGQIEEQNRNFSRFGERVWNAKDYVGFGPRDFQKSDQDIFHEVCEALTDNPKLDASEIEVDIEDGCVRLRGQVSDRMDKREAERCVEYLPGVKDVMNELHFDR
jgi:hypothetical protein